MIRNMDCGVARLLVRSVQASVLLTAMSFSVEATAQGLVAAYSFDQGAGTTLTDTSGNGNDGVIAGATWIASGRFGGALSFDGVNDSVTVADAASLDLTSAMTIEAWVYPTTVVGWRTVLMKEAGGAPPYTLYASGQGTRPSAQINNGAGVPGIVGSSALASSAWSHLAATYDGSSLRLYVNGALIKSRALTGAIVVSNGSLRIGGNSVWGEYFQGSIDEVRIYNRALSAAEIASDISAPIGVADTQAPSTPTNLTATAVSSTRIDLSWTASTDDVAVTGYLVERCEGSSCTNFTQIGTPTTNSFSSTGLTADTTYRFRIRARDAVPNDSAYSSIASATTSAAPDTEAPTSPTNLTATAVSSTQLNLGWNASTDNVAVTGYLLERCQGASCTNFSQIAIPTTTSYNDTGLTASTTYRYRVRARDAVPNYSADSAIVSSATLSAPDTEAPTTPTGLTVTAGTNQLVLAWNASTDDAGVTAYLIERCAGSGCTYSQVASVATTSYSDTSVAVGTSYSYRVRARDAVPNYSAYSNVGTATPTTPPPTECDSGTPGTPATFETIGTPTGVSLTNGGYTVTFTGSTPTAVRSTVAIAQGGNNFYYFEAKRQNTAVGVSGSTPQVGAATTDSVMSTRPGTWLGFAVDYRQKYPVVYVLTDTPTGSCTIASAAEPCVIDRVQMTGAPSNSLSIYAYKAGGSTASVTINTGNDLIAKPFNLSPRGVRKALRTKWYQGDRGLNAQWPTSTGPFGTPSIERVGGGWAVLRQGDAASISAAACAASLNGNIKWVDANGIERGTGGTLDLTPLTGALGVGEHTLMATLTEPATNRYAETKYRFTVLGLADDPDNDNDGLRYTQEMGTTDPGDPDSDDDGLSDGVEFELGLNPTLADTNGNGTRDGRELAGSSSLLEKLTLITESGDINATGSGVVISDDGFGAAFTSDLNQDCVQRRAPFNVEPFLSDTNPTGPCMKLAVRTSAGIKQGEFRYFETRRLFAASNIGHGLITRLGRIDPYCCIVNPGEMISEWTPASMSVNSVNAGTWVQLRSTGAEAWTVSNKFGGTQTEYYGFAVDYTGANPIVYVVGNNASGVMTVLRLPQLAAGANGEDGFDGLEVIPMLYGSRISNTAAVSTINLGLQRFHYNTTAVRDAIAALGNPNTYVFIPGIGIHRRPL